MGGNHRWEVGDHWHDDDGRMGATGTAGRWATTGTTRMGVWEPVAPLGGGGEVGDHWHDDKFGRCEPMAADHPGPRTKPQKRHEVDYPEFVFCINLQCARNPI